MAEGTTGGSQYTGNSNKDKKPDVATEKVVEQVVSGPVVERKKPLGRRIAENLTGSDAKSVGHYVLFNVVLPRFKDLVLEVGESALRKALFGDSATSAGYTSASRRGWSSYNTASSGAVPKQAAVRSAVAASAPSDEFGEIVVPTREDAENVMLKMSNLIEAYNMASVSDLKACVGMSGQFTDEKYGWLGMGGTDIRRVGGAQPGFALIFPQPEPLP